MRKKLTAEEFRSTMVDRIIEFLEILGVETPPECRRELERMRFAELLNLYLSIWSLELLQEAVNILRARAGEVVV